MKTSLFEELGKTHFRKLQDLRIDFLSDYVNIAYK